MKIFMRLSGLFLIFCSLHAELVELITVIPGIVLDVRYATTNNFTGKKVYPSARCFLQKPAAMALKKVQADLAKSGAALKIFDAYRPLSVQKIFWSICSDDRYVADPAKGSRHNRGCAVDLTLVDLETGEELIMPSGFDDFSEKAGRDESKMSAEVLKNYQLLDAAMTRYGFIGLASEWWHYDFDPEHNRSWAEYPVLDIDIENIGVGSAPIVA